MLLTSMDTWTTQSFGILDTMSLNLFLHILWLFGMFLSLNDVTLIRMQFDWHSPSTCILFSKVIQLVSAQDRDLPAVGQRFYFKALKDVRNRNFTIRDFGSKSNPEGCASASLRGFSLLSHKFSLFLQHRWLYHPAHLLCINEDAYITNWSLPLWCFTPKTKAG